MEARKNEYEGVSRRSLEVCRSVEAVSRTIKSMMYRLYAGVVPSPGSC
jgi:hypothetical protein